MVKHLTKHGNSLALVIDKGVLELLGIGPDTPLAITTDGTCLIVSTVRSVKRRAAFQESLKKVNLRNGRALKRVAE
jgi:antitoxin component of MazEF toxin-antitoxin module